MPLPPATPSCSPNYLVLADKLSARVSQQLAAFPQEQNWQLHLLHLMFAVDSAAQLHNEAALLEHIGAMQPLASKMLGCHRERILLAVAAHGGPQAHQATARLLMDSIIADGSPGAISETARLLSHLSLPPAQHLQVLSSCCKVLLEGTPEASKSLQWMQCNQVRAVEWGAGCLKL